MIRINNIKIPITKKINLEDIIIQKLNIKKSSINNFKISKKSIDARNKNNIFYVYSVDVDIQNEDTFINDKDIVKIIESKYENIILKNKIKERPVVIGSGPAGLFATLTLAEAGLNPILIERGKKVEERIKDVYSFFKTSNLNPESNVQFGEGGAGTFSDGKLTTNTHDFRIKKVLNEFVKSGANEEILYLSKPHIGSDKLIQILKNIRSRIEVLGGEYRFQEKVIDFSIINNALEEIKILNQKNNTTHSIKSSIAILAVGHSSRDTFKNLDKIGLHMKLKTFSVGIRIEHHQEMINKNQYGKYYKNLPPAEYKLHTKANGRGVYTFCMCPGGVVIPAASEVGHLVINGMSYNNRALENANSAILVNVNPEDFDSQNIGAGIDFQYELEKKAFELGGSNYKAPVQLLGDFMKNKKSVSIDSVKPSYFNGYTLTNLHECLPDFITNSIIKGIYDFDKKIKGFLQYDTVLTGVETRSSSSISIPRNEKFFANIRGFIPCGEGGGHAGGIMSAAVDGIKCAEAVIHYYNNLKG